MAPSTKQVYARAWNLIQECMECLNLPCISLDRIPLCQSQVLSFISFLNLKGLAPSTITTYTAAIGYVHKCTSQYDPTSSFLVQKTLSSINKNYVPNDCRLPITQFVLARLLESIPTIYSIPYHVTLLRAMFVTAFYGLFRVGELTKQNSGVISLEVRNVTISDERIVFAIINFKNNKTNKPFDVVINRQPSNVWCPVSLILDYVKLRGSKSGPFFCFANLQHVTRSFFSSRLSKCLSFCGFNTKLYKSHSFRIGGASYLASLGFTDLQIKLIGRWNSDTFVRYIRNQRYNV